MLQIRRGVFETNSSSSHSIIIKKQDRPITRVTDPGWRMFIDEDDENNPRNGFIYFDNRDLEYGRDPFHFLVDWYDRLAYAIASKHTKADIESFREICKRRITGFKDFRFPHDEWAHEEDDYYGYVDHQSEGLLNKVLEHYHISLEDFIFNDRYVIVIDGDEYQFFNTLTEQEFFDRGAIEHIEPAEKWWQKDEDREYADE